MSLDDAAAKVDALLQPSERHPAYVPTQRERSAPKGWEAGVRFEGRDRIVTTPWVQGDLKTEPEWQPLLETMQGPLPAGYVVELVKAVYNEHIWTRDEPYGEDGKKKPAVTVAAWKYEFRVKEDTSACERIDLDELIDEVRTHKRPPGSWAPSTSGDALCVLLTDWQIGKSEGDGLVGTVVRIEAMITAVETRIHELRTIGRSIDVLAVFLGGDLFEGCSGFYPMQEFSVTIDRRKQSRLVRRLVRDALIAWAPLVGEILVTGVGGNHGEHRKDGKSFTTFGDNDDVTIMENVEEILRANPIYDHILFKIPDDDLAITVPLAGHIVGLTHGHLARGSGTPEAKLRSWYNGQAGGKRPVGDADVLLTAHYHSWASADWGGCLWMQGPTLDGGSRWFTDTTGLSARQGTLTFTLDAQEFVRDIAIV